MVQPLGRPARGRRLVPAVALLLTLGLGGAPRATAADLDTLDTSLKLVPADAAFYASLLRGREQYDAVVNSKAFARVKAMPVVQQGLQMLQAKMQEQGNPAADVHKFFQQPENQQLLDLVVDMVSHEVFSYGGNNAVDILGLIQQANTAQQFAPLGALLGGKPEEANRAQMRAVLETLAANPAKLKAPDLVFGFKLTDTARAETQLKRLEKVANHHLAQNPDWKNRVRRAKVAGGDFLVLTVDGAQVPWDQIPIKDYEEKPGEFDALLKQLKQAKLTVSLGVRGQYLILALGESTATAAKLGAGKGLASLPEFKKLAPYADRKLTAIGYSSAGGRALAASGSGNVNDLVKSADEWLKDAPLPDELKKKIKKDLAVLAQDLQRFASEPGAALSFSFLADSGTETLAYDWTKQSGMDASKPLTILQHAGGSPILAAAGRSTYNPQNYDLLVKWVKIAWGYAEQFALPQLPDEQKQMVQKFMKDAQPLFKRLDDATGKMLLPALKDGQTAFVLDGKLLSKQWHQALPETDRPMPMVEPAFVCGVSDAALLVKAFSEYREVINGLIGVLGQFGVPPLQLPPPEAKKVQGGTVYFYPLPEILGFDRQILPNAGLSDKVFILALSESHTSRLLTPTPLKAEIALLANATGKPLGSAVSFDWAGLITAAAPWVEYGVKAAVIQPLGAEGDAKAAEAILQQVRTGLEVLKVFRGYASATAVEDGAVVTHAKTLFQDLAK